jgi:cell division transport system permease protein
MKPKRVGSLLKRIMQNVAASPYLHVAATGSIAFALVIVGVFFLLFVNINQAIKAWQKNIRVVAYLKDSVSKQDVAGLQQSLSNLEGVAQVLFISKQEAWDHLKKHLEHRASLLEGLDQNPLPASFEMTLAHTQRSWASLALLTRKIQNLPGVDQVEYGQTWVHRFSGFIAFFRLAAVVIGIFVLASSVFVCANTIRLTVFARREEFEIMRLVGATEGFVKIPFYVQNVMEGLLAGLIALGLLLGTYQFFVAKAQKQALILSTFEFRFLPLSGILAMLSVGMMLGWLGSYLSLRQFLRS